MPKGIVRDNGGHAVALKWSMKNIYGMQPGEVFWAASDLGWAVGHSYIVYAPLLYGCTTIVHEGKPVGTPDAGEFWRVIEEHGVRTLFTAPTSFRAIKREDPNGEFYRKHPIPDFRALFLAGERLDPDTYHWARSLLQRPVIDHWWQTETGWPVAANCLGLTALPVKPGSPTKCVPGYVVEDGKSDRNYYVALYDGAVRYADYQVQLLIRQIRDLGLEGGTVFVVTADHGESLGGHEYYFHHGFYLYDDIVKVPLIISGAGVDGRGAHVRAQVRTIDILPTLLELTGVAAGEPLEGESLCPALGGKGGGGDREAFITDGRRSALRAGGWKLIYTDPSVPLLGFEKLHDAGDIVNFFAWEIRRKISTPFLRDAALSYAAWVRSLAKAGYAGRGGGLRRRFVESQIGLMHRLFSDTWELYDLTADPGERHNLVRREKTRFAEMKKALLGYLKRKVHAVRGEDLSEVMKRKLRGLGYAQ
jgi:hypothetical protein